MTDESRQHPTLSQAWREHINSRLAQVPKGRSFIYFTDSHEGNVFEGGGGKSVYECLGLVKYIQQALGIQRVMYGGDIIGVERTIEEAKRTNEAFLNRENGFYDLFGDDAILNFGNHDSNCCAAQYARLNKNGFNDQMKLKDLLICDTDIYEDYIRPMERSGEMVYDEIGLGVIQDVVRGMDADWLAKTRRDAVGFEDELPVEQLRDYYIRELTSLFRLHFSRTDHEHRIKYILIDCGANAHMQFGALACGWTEIFCLQYHWLAHELMNTPSGYDVVVSSHMLGGNPTQWGGEYLAQYVLDRDSMPVYAILSAFLNRGAVEIGRTLDDEDDAHLLLKRLSRAIAAAYGGSALDFSARQPVGRVFTLAGHWHRDCTFLVTKDMQCVDYRGQRDETAIPAIFTVSESVSRSGGRLTGAVPDATAIDVVTLTDDGRIVLTRVGHGESRTIL